MTVDDDIRQVDTDISEHQANRAALNRAVSRLESESTGAVNTSAFRKMIAKEAGLSPKGEELNETVKIGRGSTLGELFGSSLPADSLLLPQAREFLSTKIPQGTSVEDLTKLRDAIAKRLPKWTVGPTTPEQLQKVEKHQDLFRGTSPLGITPTTTHEVRRGEEEAAALERFPRLQPGDPGVAERGLKGEAARRLAAYKATPRAAQFAEQFGSNALQTLPSLNMEPGGPNRTPYTPTPEGFQEGLAGAFGAATVFGGEGAAVMALGGGPAAAAAIPALLEGGTPVERLVRGAVFRLAGAGSHEVGVGIRAGAFEQGAKAAESGVARLAARGTTAGLSMIERRGTRMIGARGAAAAVDATATIAQHAVGPVVFGGLAPYGEFVGSAMVGEPIALPKLEDVAQGMISLGIIGATSAGGPLAVDRAIFGRRGSRPSGGGRDDDGGGGGGGGFRPSTVPVPGIGRAGGEPGSARSGMGPVQDIRTKPRVIKLTNETRPIVQELVRGLEGDKVNIYDKNRTPARSFTDRLAEKMDGTENPSVEQITAWAKQARAEVLALKFQNEALSEPEGGSPELRRLSEETSVEWQNELGGKEILLRNERGELVRGNVLVVANYPYPGVELPVRILVADMSNRNSPVATFMFKDFAEIATARAEAVKSVQTSAEQAEAAATGRLTAPGEMPLEGREALAERDAAPPEAEAAPAAPPLEYQTRSEYPKRGRKDKRARAKAEQRAAEFNEIDPELKARVADRGDRFVVETVKGTGRLRGPGFEPPESEAPAVKPKPKLPQKPTVAEPGEIKKIAAELDAAENNARRLRNPERKAVADKAIKLLRRKLARSQGYRSFVELQAAERRAAKPKPKPKPPPVEPEAPPAVDVEGARGAEVVFLTGGAVGEVILSGGFNMGERVRITTGKFKGRMGTVFSDTRARDNVGVKVDGVKAGRTIFDYKPETLERGEGKPAEPPAKKAVAPAEPEKPAEPEAKKDDIRTISTKELERRFDLDDPKTFEELAEEMHRRGLGILVDHTVFTPAESIVESKFVQGDKVEVVRGKSKGLTGYLNNTSNGEHGVQFRVKGGKLTKFKADMVRIIKKSERSRYWAFETEEVEAMHRRAAEFKEAPPAEPDKPLPQGELPVEDKFGLAGGEGKADVEMKAPGTFEAEFESRVLKGMAAEEARAKAEEASETKAPKDFDAEARAATIKNQAREAAGQESLFGAPKPPVPEAKGASEAGAPKKTDAKGVQEFFQGPKDPAVERARALVEEIIGSEDPTKVAAKYTPEEAARVLEAVGKELADREVLALEGRAAEKAAKKTAAPELAEGEFVVDSKNKPILDAEGNKIPKLLEAEGRSKSRTIQSAEIKFAPEVFQNRTSKGKLVVPRVDPKNMQTLLNRGNGFSMDAIRENPPIIWVDKIGAIGAKGDEYALSGHHRGELARFEWAKDKNGVWQKGREVSREIPVVEFSGTLAEAKQKAITSNLESIPNTTIERAHIARTLADQGSEIQEIADRVTGGNKTQAQQLVNLSHLDGKLQEEYFGAESSVESMTLEVGSFLGAFTKRHNVHAEHQRTWLKGLAHKDFLTIDQLKTAVNGYLEVLQGLNQTELLSKKDMGADAVTPMQSKVFLGRAYEFLKEKRSQANLFKRAGKKGLEVGGTEKQLDAAREQLNRGISELKKATALKSQMQTRIIKAIQDSREGGEPLIDALYEIQLWVNKKLGPEIPGDFGGPGSLNMLGLGPVGQAVSRMIFQGVPNAIKRANKARRNQNRIEDRATKRAVYEEPLTDNEILDDAYANRAFVRILTNMKLGTGAEILPPHLLRKYQIHIASQAMYEEAARMEWEVAVGDPDAIKYFAKHGPGSAELSRALRGKTHRIPKKYRGAIQRIKRMLDEVHARDLEHAIEMGQELPKFRKDYGHPHIVEGEAGSPVRDFLRVGEDRAPEDFAQKEMEERFNRFYNRRAGALEFSNDATAAIEQRLHESAAKYALDPFLKAASEYMRSESTTLGPMSKRGQLVRDFIKSWHFRKKGYFEELSDRGLRKVFYSKLTEGIQEAPLADAARFNGTTTEALLRQGTEVVYWVPNGTAVAAGVEAPSGAKIWTKIGVGDGRGTYWGAARGNVMHGAELPVARRFVKAAVGITTDRLRRTAGFGKIRGTEAQFRHRAKTAAFIGRLQRNPTDVMVGLWTGATSRALIGWNMGATNVNLGSTMITTLPEYGLIPYIAGIKGASKSLQRKALRNYIDTRERLGFLSKEDADFARSQLPILHAEIAAEIGGTSQGETQRANQRMQDMMEGRDPQMWRVLRALGPYGAFSAVEGWNRTLSIIAADAYARRVLGLEGKAPELYLDMMEGRQKAIQMMQDKGSAESFAALGVAIDQFAYNPLGQPTWFSGPYGRLLGQLGTWPLNYFKNFVVRTTIGAGAVSGAATRGVVSEAKRVITGKRLSRKTPPRRGRTPKSWFELWLEENGAGMDQQHHAAVFVRQMAVGSMLLALTDATNVNFAVFGTPPQLVAGLAILRGMFPNDERIARWYKEGVYGVTVNMGRGFTSIGPTASVAADGAAEMLALWQKDPGTREPTSAASTVGASALGAATAGILSGGKPSAFIAGGIAGSFLGPYFPWDTLMEVVRRGMVAGEAQWKRMIANDPETIFRTFGTWPFVMFGVNVIFPGQGEVEKARSNLRMITEHERDQRREPAPGSKNF